MTSTSESTLSEIDAGPKPLSLRRNFSWSLVGNIVYAGCQWGMLLVLAKLCSVESVGVFGFALAVTAPIIIFGNLQLRTVLATDAKRQHAFGEYFALRLASLTLGLSAISVIALLGRFPQETVLVILIIGFAKAIESISDIIYGLLLQNERMDQIARLQIIKGCLSLVAMGFTVYITESVIWGAVAMAGTWTFCLVAFDYPSAIWCLGKSRRHELYPRWNVLAMLRLGLHALPLGFGMLLGSLMLNIPRYYVKFYLGMHGLGIFMAISSFMILGQRMFNPLIHTASPRLAKHFMDQDLAAFRRVLTKVIVLGIAIGSSGVAVSIFAGRELLTIFFSPEYTIHQTAFVYLMLALTVSVGGALDPVFTALRLFWTQLFIWFIVIGCLIVFSVILIPELGLIGASLSILFANVVRLITVMTTLYYFSSTTFSSHSR